MLPASSPQDKTQEKKAGLAYWANRTLEECDKASQDFAPDPVHDLRVAIRRCRSMADGFISVDPDPEWKQMKKLGKTLFTSLGDLRDTQVMCGWIEKLSHADDPVRHILLHSLHHRETDLKAAAEDAVRNFDRKRWSALNAHLDKRTGKVPLESLVFQHLALERWYDAYALHRRALRNRSQVGYHQLRIGIKKFRYTVENFLPQRHENWAKDLRDLQDALGEVHDFDVLWTLIKAHPEISPDARAGWRKRLLEEQQKRLTLYRAKMVGKNSLWQKWRQELPRGEELQRAAMQKLKTWASFLDPDLAHSAYVTRLALQLYDGLEREGVIRLGPEDRRLLEAAAVLHEIGRAKADNGHRKRAYRMIRKIEAPLGWRAEDLNAVAVIARYHRGALPQSRSTVFAGVTAKRRSELQLLAGILRLANAFDFSRERRAARITIRNDGGLVTISGPEFAELSPEAERLAQARYLLEAVSGISIVLRPVAGGSSRPAPRRPAQRRGRAPARKIASAKKN